MAHYGAADSVLAPNADDVAGMEAVASTKGDAVFGEVDHLHASMAGMVGFVLPGNRQFAGCGFSRF